MKAAKFLQLVCISVLSFAAHASIIPQTYLSLASDQGDPVGLGNSYFFIPPSAHIIANTPSGPISNLGFLIDPGLGLPFSGGSISSGDSSTPLTVGQYDNASNLPGHPSLDFFVEDRFPSDPTGWFHIYDLTFDSIGSVQSLALTFEQHSNGNAPALRGVLSINSTFDLPAASAVPEPGTLALMLAGLGLLVFTARMKSKQSEKVQRNYPDYSRVQAHTMSLPAC